jgi:hypothetical protein
VLVLCFIAAWVLLRRYVGKARDRSEGLFDRAA